MRIKFLAAFVTLLIYGGFFFYADYISNRTAINYLNEQLTNVKLAFAGMGRSHEMISDAEELPTEVEEKKKRPKKSGSKKQSKRSTASHQTSTVHGGNRTQTHTTSSPSYSNAIQGQVIDSYNGVPVYYNKSMRNTDGRNVTADGYNLGLRWQCVEYVKRYYYERFGHKMPNAYGNAKELFQHGLRDGGYNSKRALLQYNNPSRSKPQREDILVFRGYDGNPFGHVCIISQVHDQYIEIVQQNVGTDTRGTYPLNYDGQHWSIGQEYIVGWLRMERGA